MNKKIALSIIGMIVLMLLVVGSVSAGPVVKSTGKDAALMGVACDMKGGAYCNPYQIEGASGKVNMIQPNGNIDVILGISANGLHPEEEYRVYFDTNGGTPGPWILMGTFTTDEYGSGKFNYTAHAGTYTPGLYTVSVYINRTDVGYTVLISEDITFEITG